MGGTALHTSVVLNTLCLKKKKSQISLVAANLLRGIIVWYLGSVQILILSGKDYSVQMEILGPKRCPLPYYPSLIKLENINVRPRQRKRMLCMKIGFVTNVHKPFSAYVPIPKLSQPHHWFL